MASRGIDIEPVFGPSFRCSESLRQLRLQTGGPDMSFSFSLACVRAIVQPCPNLVALDIKGNWVLEAVRAGDTATVHVRPVLSRCELSCYRPISCASSKPLKELRRFMFDHAPGRSGATRSSSNPARRTIRSERNGKFPHLLRQWGPRSPKRIGKRISAATR